jgi:hypothetical protein
VRLEGLDTLREIIRLLVPRTRDLPVCSTVLQLTTLHRAPKLILTETCFEEMDWIELALDAVCCQEFMTTFMNFPNNGVFWDVTPCGSCNC